MTSLAVMKKTCGQSCSRLCLCSGQQWRRLRAKLPRRRMVKIYLLIFLNMFSNSFAITMLFPYLPFLMEFLIPSLEEKDVGKYIGYVAGSLYLGRALGSYFWGVASDRWGRRPVMIVSSVLVGLSTLMFGFSVSFSMAVIARFLSGISNGMISACKSVVSEISDDSNQAFGIAIVGVAWGTGYVIGPAVSGAIADPIGQYNLTVTNSFLNVYLTRFPYSLPAVVSCLLFTISTVLTVLFLPETLGVKKSRKRSEVDQVELAAFRSRLGVHEGVSADDSRDISQTSLCVGDHTDETRLLDEGEESGDSETRTGNLFISNPSSAIGSGSVSVDSSVSFLEEHEDKGEAMVEGTEEEEAWHERGEEEEREELVEVENTLPKNRWSRYRSGFLSTLKHILLDLRLFLCDCASLTSLIIYCCYSFAAISFNEIFSLWAYTQPHLGGLGFSLHEIGICLTFVGVMLLPVTLVAFPLVEKRLHSIKTFYLVGISLTFLLPMMPHTHYLISHKLVLWFVLVILAFLINVMITLGFSCNFMFINNSVTFDKLGSINGLSVTMSSVSRSLAPIISGSLFSLSLSDATLAFGFPVDYNLVFVVLATVVMTTVFLVACLPTSINKQKIIEDV